MIRGKALAVSKMTSGFEWGMFAYITPVRSCFTKHSFISGFVRVRILMGETLNGFPSRPGKLCPMKCSLVGYVPYQSSILNLLRLQSSGNRFLRLRIMYSVPNIGCRSSQDTIVWVISSCMCLKRLVHAYANSCKPKRVVLFFFDKKDIFTECAHINIFRRLVW